MQHLSVLAMDMSVGATDRLSLGNNLRRALERHELQLHYQPQVDLGTGRVIGVEALMRWQHPEWGSISPAKFIPVAEETGLIVPLGEWGLIEACRQAREWQQSGLPDASVAVNVSAIQLRQPTFPQMVAKVLQESHLDPRYLELEITESAVMHNVEACIAMVQQLSDMGLWISIDDFGTGYSSLNHLWRFQVRRLKIDISFTRNITTDLSCAAITSAIIGLGKRLNLRVLAEGVETREQLRLLQTQGCEEIQGYYFSMPLPADELAKLMREDRRLA